MTTVAGVQFDVQRLAKLVEDTRKDALSIDFARIIGVHFGQMVQHFSKVDGQPVSAHNNKVLFLEGLDIWCRRMMGCPDQAKKAAGGTWTQNPRDVVLHAMEPWEAAIALPDPSVYVLRSRPPAPVYMGRQEDLTAYFMGLAACLEVGPVRFRLGKSNGVYEHLWAKIFADGKWYDSDLSNPQFKLGDYYEFEDYDEMEIPL